MPQEALHLSGQLFLEVDGAPVHITGNGAELKVVARDVASTINRAREAAIRSDGGLPGRQDLGRVADALAERGITARLESPTHPVLVLGAGVDSAVGGLVLGTRRARPAGVAALTATDQGRWVLVGAAAGVLAAATALLRRPR